MNQLDAEDDRWVDARSAVALTGIRRYDLVLAITGGQVQWSTKLPGHERVLMVALTDVQWLADSLYPSAKGRALPG